MAYREAEKLGETLAMSNLAYKFMNEGFIAEAEELTKKATAMENYHPNIGGAISKIKNSQKEVEEKEEKILESLVTSKRFLIDYAYACTKKSVQSIPQVWQGPKCKFQITIQNGIFEATGFYEYKKKKSWWPSESSSSSPDDTTVRENMKYLGNINGNGVIYQYWTWQGIEPFVTSTNPKPNGFMIISDDIKQIQIYEIGSRSEDDIVELTLIGN